LENSCLGTGTTNDFQKSQENSGLAKGFIQHTAEMNHIPGQEKFDH
jgi:hypothetical protein